VIDGIKVLTKRADGMDPKDLRDFGDKLRDKLGSASWHSARSRTRGEYYRDGLERPYFPVSRRPDHQGNGGHSWRHGRRQADLAQSGGKDPAKLDAALDALYAIINKKT